MNLTILPKKNYVQIWLLLIVLLVLTRALAHVNLGSFNVAVALAIAIAKIFLVLLFFMHVRYESRVIWIFVAAGFIWLLIMFDLTLSDYLTRDSVPGNYQADPYQGVSAPSP